LAANVATMTANNTSFVGTTSAANVVSNAQLIANLANYQTTAGISGYQTTAGLASNVVTLTSNNSNYLGGTAAASYQLNSGMAANVATMTANNTSFVGTTSAANVVSNTQLQSNLGNYQTTAGLAANVATLISNNSNYLGGVLAASYQTTAGLAANVATMTANNTSFVGTTSAANVVSNAQLIANLANYQTTAGLAANVVTLTSNNSNYLGGTSAASYQLNSTLAANVATITANNSTNFAGQPQSYYANVTSPVFSGNISVGNSVITNQITVNGAVGTAGQALLSGGGTANDYWGTVSVSPGGSNTQLQINESGSFGGSAALTFNYSSNVLSVNGTLSVGSGAFTANSTLVNAAAVNVTGAVNTATVFATGSINAASVFLANSTALTHGTNTFTLGTSSVTANGYTYLPNGLLMQWGHLTYGSILSTITFPISFTINCYSLSVMSSGSISATFYVGTLTNIHASISSNTSSGSYFWTAVGV